jgi:hypothetical protein
MKRFGLRCYVFSLGAAVLMLAACGGSQSVIGAPGATMQNHAVAMQAARGSLTGYSKTFFYTGKRQIFIVPSGITEIKVDARGAQGGGSSGGFGGHVVAWIAATPGEKLHVLVGGQPSAASGGFNGGGSGGTPSGCRFYCGFGGGGASDVRDTKKLANRIIVAGGGGGQGGSGYHGYDGGVGGEGGAKRGGTGGPGGAGYFGDGGGGGSGGTQREGGAGGSGGEGSTGNGAPGFPGSFGEGGQGGQGSENSGEFGGNGGGGGGGYYGGGGGGAGGGSVSVIVAGGGGGGGSSYIRRGAKKLVDSRGWKHATGNGLVIISW